MSDSQSRAGLRQLCRVFSSNEATAWLTTHRASCLLSPGLHRRGLSGPLPPPPVSLSIPDTGPAGGPEPRPSITPWAGSGGNIPRAPPQKPKMRTNSSSEEKPGGLPGCRRARQLGLSSAQRILGEQHCLCDGSLFPGRSVCIEPAVSGTSYQPASCLPTAASRQLSGHTPLSFTVLWSCALPLPVEGRGEASPTSACSANRVLSSSQPCGWVPRAAQQPAVVLWRVGATGRWAEHQPGGQAAS